MCRRLLVDGESNDSACLGENAHIYGEKEGAARYDATLEAGFVNSYENLIFLCSACHTKVDGEVDNFPPEKLMELKSEHEKWVINRLEEGANGFTFAELEVLAKHLMGMGNAPNKGTDYRLLAIEEKIKKNSLHAVQTEINMGLTMIETIKDYFNRNPDIYFAERLTNIMSQQYSNLKLRCADSVEIFNILWDITSGNFSDFKYRAAGLGILVYFFEDCEVFEK
jgi:hypothetical protein